MSDISWSDWLDLNAEQTSKIPSGPGVYMMHASMKILYIGNSANLRQAVLESLNNPCIKDAKRFKYSSIDNHEQVRTQLVKEYQEKHEGQMPRCMV